jgi:TonB family protein
MKITKEQKYGFSSSFVLCLLILLIFRFLFLQTEISAEFEGIPVQFGTVQLASGTIAPAPSSNNTKVPEIDPTPAIIPKPETSVSKPEPPTPDASLITQTAEQTAAIEAEKQRKQDSIRRVEQERLEAEQKRKEEEQRRKDAINREMADAFGMGNTKNGSQGTAQSGSGSQGSPQGNAATGAQSGTGGIGTFDLGGRSLRGGILPRPDYDSKEEGTIVVEITVNPQGDVVQAAIRLRGTNIENAIMRRAALEAVKKAKFNSINGMQNQIGTITYNYKLK